MPQTDRRSFLKRAAALLSSVALLSLPTAPNEAPVIANEAPVIENEALSALTFDVYPELEAVTFGRPVTSVVQVLGKYPQTTTWFPLEKTEYGISLDGLYLLLTRDSAACYDQLRVIFH